MCEYLLPGLQHRCVIVTCPRGRPSFLPQLSTRCYNCGSLIPVYAGSHVQVTDPVQVKSRFCFHFTFLLDNNTDIQHSFSRVSTLNPLLRFVLHLPVKASSNTRHATHTSFRHNQHQGRSNLGAILHFPIPPCSLMRGWLCASSNIPISPSSAIQTTWLCPEGDKP